MSRVSIFIGLDYSQEFVQMCVMDEDGKVLANRPVNNCAQALRQAAIACARKMLVRLNTLMKTFHTTSPTTAQATYKAGMTERAGT